jgi:hypothetical protein
MRRLRHLGPLFAEIWAFARLNKAWWIVPLVALLLLLAVLIVTGQTVAPFFYTLF